MDRELQGLQVETAPALFVFIPFCVTICTYCDFNVYARREGWFDAYVEALAQEIRTIADAGPAPRRAKTLAFGGGTPSILSAKQLGRVVEAIRDCFEFEAGSEWTLEANPGTVDADKLRALKGMGFSRLSLGVQTFDDARLRQFNRHHTTADSLEAFALARSAGLENVSIDLIYGLPEQTVEDWRETLERALALESEHLSLYGLQVEERTVLKRQIGLGRIPQPEADLAAQMYELAVERLATAGFRHYEISNFAKPGFESRHNMTYWLNDPYFGFGAGAHSLWMGERYENVKNPRVYMQWAASGSSPIASREKISRAMQMAETVFLGLRLADGLSWARFRRRFGEDARGVYREPIELLSSWGVLETDEERMKLTERGMLISNQLLWRFLPDE